MIEGMFGVLDKLDPKPESEKAEAEGEGKGVSLAEAIETRKFLGPEFLTWLWFESETFDQKLRIDLSAGPRGREGEGRRAKGEGDGSAVVELWLYKSIIFQSFTESGVEKASLSGVAPSQGQEAYEALKQGKVPIKAKIGVRLEDQEFSFVFDAQSFGLSGVKIPALLKGQGDDPFFERMTLVEKIEGVVELLFRDFLNLRLSDDWGNFVVPAMRAWMRNDEGVTGIAGRYRHLREPEPASS